MAYIVTMLVLLAVYATAVYLMKFLKNRQLANAFFALSVFLPYIWHSLYIYSQVGFYDWNFQNTLPVANVSPFMFTGMLYVLFLPKKLRKYVFLLISLLSVGMLASMVVNCVSNALIHYKFHPHFLLDYIAHVNLSLFGVYLVRSGQVELTKKACAVSGGMIYGIAFTMLILNLIFDTAFFGLSLRGKHSIYTAVVSQESIVSVLVYFAGVFVVLLLGYLYGKLLQKYTKPIE